MQSIANIERHEGPPTANVAALRIASVKTLEDAIPEAFNILETIEDLDRFLDSSIRRTARTLVAQSAAMREVLRHVQHAAPSSATVLLTGESGTGKELVARLLHTSSRRNGMPYVRVNCAALSEGLIESELFGHERGAFTGAEQTRVGRFERAAGGTLLLDEISEMPVSLQAKLLRVLEEEEYQRVGGNTTYRADVRVVATTNRDLQREVSTGNFRADLYYRLNVIDIHVPPLRERRDDIPALIEYFRQCFHDDGELAVQGFSDRAMRDLCGHDWPGNIRQLRNVVQRLCVLCPGTVVEATDLPSLAASETLIPGSLCELRLEEIERRVILASLRRHNGNKTSTARQLGVTARTLANKLKKYRELGRI